ncbi:MFS transporter [Martelella mangrovi]|uniref:MFS family permease n=1 Tax=Martelella mangrovi TaxID=1397477 RepID=A0ABV2I5T7_9HYPH
MDNSELQDNRFSPDRTAALIAVLIAFFGIPATISGVATIIPNLSSVLAVSLSQVQWVITSFLLCSAGMTVVFGAIADSRGKRRVFLFGIMLLSSASLASAFLTDYAALVIARSIAGIGAAALLATGPAVLNALFDGHRQMSVFAMFGTAIGSGLALGPVLAAFVATRFGWQSVFLVQAAFFAAAGVAMAKSAVPETGNPTAPSMAISHLLIRFAATISLFFVLIEGPSLGLGNPSVSGALAIGLASVLFLFIMHRRRRTADREEARGINLGYWGWCLSAIFPSLTFFVILLYMPTYLIVVHGLGEVEASYRMAALTAPMVVFPLLTKPGLKLGLPPFLILALACLTVLTGIGLFLGNAAPLLLSLALIGAGSGITFSLTDMQALRHIERHQTAKAAGIINTVRLGSEAVAAALYGSVFWLFLLKWSNDNPSALTRLGDTTAKLKALSALAAGKLAENVPAGILRTAYDFAFHHTVFVMFCLALTVITGSLSLIRSGREAVRIGAA